MRKLKLTVNIERAIDTLGEPLEVTDELYEGLPAALLDWHDVETELQYDNGTYVYYTIEEAELVPDDGLKYIGPDRRAPARDRRRRDLIVSNERREEGRDRRKS